MTTSGLIPQHDGRSRRTLRIGALALSVAAVGATAAVPATASSAPAPGHWTVLGAALGQPEGGAPTVWEDASHHAWVLWLRKPSSSTATYEAVEVAPNGSLTKAPFDIFAGQDWSSLTGEPTLLPAGAVPQVIFSGIQSATGQYGRGCVYGALGGAAPWTLQPWSLSANCVNPVGGAAVSPTGVLASAFPGGWATGHGVVYHIGVSATTPATEPDGQIGLTSGVAYKAAVLNDTSGTGDFSVVWAQAFSSPASGDGYFVQDVTAGKPAVKAPNSGTNSVNDLPESAIIALTASSRSRGGTYLAYCSNAATCKLQLWHVGAAKALTVPGSTGAYDVAIAAGPGGRLWVVWSNEATNKIFVVRTNSAATKFGPVRTYPTVCFEHGLIGLGSGTAGRLDLALQCVNNAKLQLQEMVTQTLVPLQVGLSSSSVANTAKRTITVSVSDVGDPVAGAKVVVAGHKATTNAKGKATITLAKGAKPGAYTVAVTNPNYLAGSAKLAITH